MPGSRPHCLFDLGRAVRFGRTSGNVPFAANRLVAHKHPQVVGTLERQLPTDLSGDQSS